MAAGDQGSTPCRRIFVLTAADVRTAARQDRASASLFVIVRQAASLTEDEVDELDEPFPSDLRCMMSGVLAAV